MVDVRGHTVQIARLPRDVVGQGTLIIRQQSVSAVMTDILSHKAAEIQTVAMRLICSLGPDRIMVGSDAEYDPASVTIVSRADPSRVVVISIAGMTEGRYAISYDRLRTKHGNDTSVEPTISSGVAFEGLHWIAQKILEDGIVTGEFERTPWKNWMHR